MLLSKQELLFIIGSGFSAVFYCFFYGLFGDEMTGDFFQKFLKQSGILADLEKAGIQEGDTVRMYGLVFDYYK